MRLGCVWQGSEEELALRRRREGTAAAAGEEGGGGEGEDNQECKSIKPFLHPDNLQRSGFCGNVLVGVLLMGEESPLNGPGRPGGDGFRHTRIITRRC